MSDTATHLLKLEDKLNRLLRTIRPSISEMTYNLLTIFGSKPGRLYDLPKIHEIEISDLKPLRPVASFDIELLFTNVPLNETTDIILNKTASSLLNSYGLNKTTYRKLLDIAAHNSVFTFNGSIYTQVDGLVMGSSLGPCHVNTFFCHHAQAWMNDCPANFKPILYRRYMDDTSLLFDDPSHINPFLSYLNSQHPIIKFTSVRLGMWDQPLNGFATAFLNIKASP
ncbi:uncharacterized protein [Penaeus vannamei]|uniref:uncharacterized protein n=1 Tax=Penaeus vannamei TaxID=6689 RepID=UPI00387F7BA1